MNDKRVAIVTGGSRGIGEAIVRKLAADGLHVVAVARSADKLEALVNELTEAGLSASSATCDVSSSESITAMVEQVVETHKRLDVLVNNAGITRDNLMLRLSDDDYDAVLNTNLKSAFVACRASLRQMMRSKSGRIINISSVAGVAGNKGQTNYAASKAGLIGMSKSLAKEVAAKGITVNVVAPGFITTDMTDALPDPVKQGVLEWIPLKRFGEVNDVAETVAFLCSEKAGYITGQVLCVDGGMVM